MGDCAEAVPFSFGSGGLVWDDNIKRWEWQSSTCSSNSDSNSGNDSSNSDSGSGNSDSGSNSQDGVCVSSCKSMKDGDYQSCKRCDGFVKCANERLFEMDCAEGGLVWDDEIKRCEWESSTCQAPSTNTEGSTNNKKNKNKNASCVSSCAGMPDGDYQSCSTCSGFVKCSNERLFNMDCAAGGLSWDDKKKRCEWESQTCKN